MLCSSGCLEGLWWCLNVTAVYVSGTFPCTAIWGTCSLFSCKPGESNWGETGNHCSYSESAIVKHWQKGRGWVSYCSFSFRRQAFSIASLKTLLGKNHQDRSVFNHNTQVAFIYKVRLFLQEDFCMRHRVQANILRSLGLGKPKWLYFLTLESFWYLHLVWIFPISNMML